MVQFGVVRTISKTTNTSCQSGDFVTMTKPEMRTGENRNTGLSNAPADPEVDNEKTSRQIIKAQISEQNEQMSIRTSELDRAVHVERESLREEINQHRQEVGRS